MFDNLAKAKAGALYKLLSKLPLEEAAIVLTNLPNQLAIQVIAYYPGEIQTEIGPAMVDARWAEPEKVTRTEAKIRAILNRMRQNLAAKDNAATAEKTSAERPAASAAPAAPAARPAPPQFGKAGNPYQAAAEKRAAEKPAAEKPATGKPAAEKRPPEPRKNEGPKPWIPRQATTSPINGPALPGTAPPVAGDPFASPLAKAGLLDLIGRAQEKLLLKSAPPQPSAGKSAPRGLPPPQPPSRRREKPARPEPVEGLLAPGAVRLLKTPRLIGAGAPKRNPAAEPPAPSAPSRGGARRMDGKAILAAILRESTPAVRGAVRGDDPGLFRQLRDRMFYFDDLALSDDNALARVFTAAPTEESALALKFAAPALRDRVLRAVSPGRARALRERAAPRAGLDEVEKAQQTVLDVALQLQSAGRILIDPRDPDLAGK